MNCSADDRSGAAETNPATSQRSTPGNDEPRLHPAPVVAKACARDAAERERARSSTIRPAPVSFAISAAGHNCAGAVAPHTHDTPARALCGSEEDSRRASQQWSLTACRICRRVHRSIHRPMPTGLFSDPGLRSGDWGHRALCAGDYHADRV